MNVLTVHRLGRVEYADGLELQRQFVAARRAGAVTDTLLLLEHPPVLTLGRGAKGGNILAPAERLAAFGIQVHETDRGGDVTYHGPGQLVGYPLLYLGPGRQDVRRYVRSLEEVIIRTLADFGIAGTRVEKWPGVWLQASRLGGLRKICALGVHLSRWYTRHGFALNVQPTLEHFELIIPCGIREAGVTSMAEELGSAVSVAEVEARVAFHFGQVFEAQVREAPEPVKTISCVVAREDGKVLLLKRIPEKGGFWQVVTGRVEDGESEACAALRELREETGLTLPVRSLGYVHAFAWGEVVPPRLAREHAFVARARADVQVVLSPGEHDAFEWVTLEALEARVPWEGLKVAARRAVAGGA
jgi:lipoyl(octanoyl) transferase